MNDEALTMIRSGLPAVFEPCDARDVWEYRGLDGADLPQMKRRCVSGNNTVSEEALNPENFYRQNQDSELKACAHVDPSLDDGEFALANFKLVFTGELVSMVVERSEDYRQQLVARDRDGKLGREYQTALTPHHFLLYIVMLMYFGVDKPSRVSDSLTQRRNRNGRGRQSLQNSTENIWFRKYIGSRVSLRTWKMLVRCFRPYFWGPPGNGSKQKEKQQILAAIASDEEEKYVGRPSPPNPVPTDNPKHAHSWRTMAFRLRLASTLRGLVKPGKEMSLDENRIKMKVNDARVSHNISKPIRDGATVQMLAIATPRLRGFPWAWNPQGGAGYMRGYRVDADTNAFAYPSSMTWEQVVAAMQQLTENEDGGTEERATEEKGDVEEKEDVEEKGETEDERGAMVAGEASSTSLQSQSNPNPSAGPTPGTRAGPALPQTTQQLEAREGNDEEKEQAAADGSREEKEGDTPTAPEEKTADEESEEAEIRFVNDAELLAVQMNNPGRAAVTSSLNACCATMASS